jgi:FlaA1/EpsC-like NDP-sugar epimerase
MRILPQNTTPRWIIFLVDLIGVCFAFFLAYLLRFEFHPPSEEWSKGLSFLPFWLMGCSIAFLLGKTYQGIIRYTSAQDSFRLFVTLSLAVAMLFVWSFSRRYWSDDGLYAVPVSILMIAYLLSLFALFVFRAGVKWSYQIAMLDAAVDQKNVLLVGGGDLARMTKRALSADDYSVQRIRFWTDPSNKWVNNRVEGMLILSQKEAIQLLIDGKVDEILLALNNEDKLIKNQWKRLALDYACKLSEVPSIQHWVNGQLSVKQIKEVAIEELLDRNEIKIDTAGVAHWIEGKTVLVTGAAGSIGSEIVKQLIQFNPARIIALDQAETPLFELEGVLQSQMVEYVIGDVRKEDRMRRLFDAFEPNVVFHAAAYKHVPLMENNPTEAILTNVWGTKVLADLAVKYKVEKFVMVSTDKAINPTNVMGASKRAAEIYVQSLNGNVTTSFITTRFGNVLGSNGSVVKIFKKQIESGGPVKVTHPEITRFFMTIPEAVQLVLQAGSMGKGGEIFVFDMGEKVKIVDLAKKMIQLSGFELNVDMEIQFSGLRPGEKLFEEVLSDDETTLPTTHEKIMIAKVRDYNWDEVKNWVDELIQLFGIQDNHLMVAKLKAFIPEYISNNSEFQKLD